MTNESTIELILKTVNIVDIISHYIPLKKAGTNYKARCPFHDEKTASFNVSEGKQIYKCFGCGKAGNAITFVRDYEKISFPEALKKIAEKAGIAIQSESFNKKQNTRLELIHTIYTLANDFFVNNFNTHGSIAKSYLNRRDIPLDIAEEFSIGYALDSFNGLKSYLTRNHINTAILHETGLFRLKENTSDVYDLFRDRLMFPIHSVNGKVVAFGGRALDDSKEKGFKYINSPTTDIYTKGKELYGLHITRFEISKKDFVYICEGYIDLIRLYQKGFKNSVASLGTALTVEQIKLLARYTKNFYLLYDGDNAGIKAAVKAAGLIIQQGCVPKIMLLPPKQDPDTFLATGNIDQFHELFHNAQNLTNFVSKKIELFSGQRQAIQMLLDITPQIEDQIVKELFVKEIADVFQISENTLKNNIKTPEYYSEPEEKPKKKVIRCNEERWLLKLLLKNPQNIKTVSQNLEISDFFNESYQNIYSYLINLQFLELLENPPILLERFNETLQDNEKEIFNDFSELFFEEEFYDTIDDLVNIIKQRKIMNELKELNYLISQNINDTDLFEKKDELKEKLRKLKNKL